MPVFCDRASIIAVTRDPETGAETKAAAVEARAFYEPSGKLSYTKDGTPYIREALYFLPANTSIKKGDLIKPTRLKGRVIVEDYSVVKTAQLAGGLNHVSHIEVET